MADYTLLVTGKRPRCNSFFTDDCVLGRKQTRPRPKHVIRRTSKLTTISHQVTEPVLGSGSMLTSSLIVLRRLVTSLSKERNEVA